jgi:hypothetical protein
MLGLSLASKILSKTQLEDFIETAFTNLWHFFYSISKRMLRNK